MSLSTAAAGGLGRSRAPGGAGSGSGGSDGSDRGSGGSGGSGGSVDEELVGQLRSAIAALFGAERRLRGREQRKGSSEISHAHIRALSVLVDNDEVTAGALAKAADLNPASVTPMLDQFEAKGLIERRRSDEDRRVTMVSLTPVGRTKVCAVRGEWQAKLAAALGDFSPDQIRTGCEVIARLGAFMEGVASGEVSGPRVSDPDVAGPPEG